MCSEILENDCEKIGGQGKTVEIDESKFGKRKYHRGKRVEGVWVFGGIERESRRSFFRIVEDRSAETLIPIIKEFVLPGTTIISDCWKAYSSLSKEGEGKRNSRVVSALASCARGPEFDPRRRRGKFVGPSLLPFVSFAGMT